MYRAVESNATSYTRLRYSNKRYGGRRGANVEQRNFTCPRAFQKVRGEGESHDCGGGGGKGGKLGYSSFCVLCVVTAKHFGRGKNSMRLQPRVTSRNTMGIPITCSSPRGRRYLMTDVRVIDKKNRRNTRVTENSKNEEEIPCAVFAEQSGPIRIGSHDFRELRFARCGSPCSVLRI